MNVLEHKTSLTKGIQYIIDVYVVFSKKLHKPRLHVVRKLQTAGNSKDTKARL